MKIPTQGRIGEHPVYQIIQELIRDKATGFLTLSGTEDTIVIMLEFGMCVGVESHYPRESLLLGEMLVKRRLLTEATRDALLNKQQSALVKFGGIAREDGLVTPIQLMDALEDQMMLVLFPTLTWRDGLYHFRIEESVLYDKDAFRPLDLKYVEEFGEKILKNWQWIRDRFPTMESIPIFLPDVEVLPPGVQPDSSRGDGPSPIILTSEQERVYNLINGVFDIQDIIGSCHQFPWLTLMALADLEDSGAISVPAPREVVPRYSAVLDDVRDRFRDGFRYLLLFTGIAVSFLLLMFLPFKFLPSLESSGIAHERQVMTKVKLDQVRFALSVYELTNHGFPEFLSELQEQQYVRESDLFDSWGAKFYYQTTDTGYVLISGGPDQDWATADDIGIEMEADEYENGCYFPLWAQRSSSGLESNL